MISPSAFAFSIRPMTDEDIKTPDRWVKPVSSIERDFRHEKTLGFVAVHEKKIIGYVGLQLIPEDDVFSSHNIPEILELYVFKLYRSRGIATALIRVCEETAYEKGWSTIGLSVGITPEDEAAHRLYTRLGYRPIEDVSENWRLALCKRLD